MPVPEGLDGRSFWPALTGGECPSHEFIVFEWNFGGPQDDYYPVRALRTEKWHLIRNFGPHNHDQRRLEEIPPDFTNEQRRARRYKDYGPDFQHPTRFSPEFELYDLESDPHELRNLAGEPSHAEIRQELAAKLERWMVKNDDHVLRGEIPVIPNPAGMGHLFV